MKKMALPPARLLGALSQAFSYPERGLKPAMRGLEQLDDATSGPWSRSVDDLVAKSRGFADVTAERLAYTRLFVGSLVMLAPPYASYYLDEGHMINGPAAAEVAAIYAQFGLRLAPAEIAPADHLRYLLAFLCLLAARFEETGEAAFAEAFAAFRDAYVLSWIDSCADLVQRNAQEPFYPAFMKLASAVLRGVDV